VTHYVPEMKATSEKELYVSNSQANI